MSLLPHDPYTKWNKLVDKIVYELENGVIAAATVADYAIGICLDFPWLPITIVTGSAALILFVLNF